MAADSFCSSCGTAYADVTGYPRRCEACGSQVWVNPAPVAVVLLPVVDGDRTGLLAIRRAIPPVGALTLVSGFVERHETWQEAAAREMQEETGVEIAPEALRPLWFTSTAPDPVYVLLFAQAPAVKAEDLPPFVPNREVSERKVIFDLSENLAFPQHAQMARDYFATL
ncbi:NUDIX domain-containing protein [Actinocrispum wychmicini]|uniref:NUDIX domain-containing protein n=1 Tax=Actinocrispum wychmicini TaxID=1213861 RepID=A0A4R2IQU6_9PSEU|nr:NUDIX domain-containing protein [Actinocrispum wychmicini]TCO47277.1 NUDIX domain-containing protein [Actinocrispum wychmicini]